MNFQLFSFPLLFNFLFLLLLFMRWSKSKKVNNKPLNLPPGPWKLPIIGNMHQLVGHQFHQIFKQMADKYGPIMTLQLGEISTIVVSSPETAKAVLKTHDMVLSQRPFLLVGDVIFYKSADIVYSSCNDSWKQMKKICTSELLGSKRVQSFQQIRIEAISNLIIVISSKAGFPVNLSKMLFSLTSTILATAAFGKIFEDQETFMTYAKEITEMLTGLNNVVDFFPSYKLLHMISGIHSSFQKLHKKVDLVLENIINEHKNSIDKSDRADDLIYAMLNVQAQGNLELPLTTDNIKAVILDMFLGGTDSSAAAIEWAMSEMIRHPNVMRKAQEEVRQVLNKEGNVDKTGLDELRYLKSVIKETLRLHPPGPLMIPRESIEHCKINGYDIPAKTRVIVNAYAVGRDPEYWHEPEKFVPERFSGSENDYSNAGNFGFLPFGGGRRKCPGMLFGMANVEFTVAQLLYHFDWEVCSGKSEDLDMTEVFATVTSRQNHLYLIPTPYSKFPVQ